MDTLTILRNAYHLLDDKKHWTQGAYAHWRPGVRDPVEWCAVGALHPFDLGAWGQYSKEQELLDDAAYQMYDMRVIDVNDHLGYRQVRAVYRRAIRELEAAGEEEPPAAGQA